jgi:hypothetical protein
MAVLKARISDIDRKSIAQKSITTETPVPTTVRKSTATDLPLPVNPNEALAVLDLEAHMQTIRDPLAEFPTHVLEKEIQRRRAASATSTTSEDQEFEALAAEAFGRDPVSSSPGDDVTEADLDKLSAWAFGREEVKG